MKTTMISVLAAALATVCSAAPTAAAVAQPLPAKFSLNFTPREGTSLNKFPPPVLTEPNYGQSLYTGDLPKSGEIMPVTFLANGTGAYVHHTESGVIFDGLFSVHRLSGWVDVFPMREHDTDRILTGFGQVGGLLTLDLNNGKGPQSLWKSCYGGSGSWTIYWDPSSVNVETRFCLKIDLTVVPA